ncbi:MAG: carbohydrate ABC transporter permease [Alphaproteobacteria bacterium]
MTTADTRPGALRPPFDTRLAEALGAGRARRVGALSTLPAQLLLIFIFAFPTVVTIYISLTSWTPLDGVSWVEAHRFWAWFDNYAGVFQDGRLGGAIARTLLMVAIAVAAEFLLGFGLALLFIDRFAGRAVYYSLFLLPMMVVPAVSGYMFLILFQSTGPINQFISLFTPGDFEMVWFTDKTTAFIAVVAADIWQWTPMMFLILLAGLIGVPEDQIKAARLLGASARQILWRISLPRIRTVIAIAIGIRFIEALKLFDVMYIMTKGGPGVATETLSLYIYKRTYGDLEWAYVAALGLTIVIVMSALGVLVFALVRRYARRRLAAAPGAS